MARASMAVLIFKLKNNSNTILYERSMTIIVVNFFTILTWFLFKFLQYFCEEQYFLHFNIPNAIVDSRGREKSIPGGVPIDYTNS